MIYIVREMPAGPVKIGYTEDVDARLKVLQNGNPRALVILGTLSGGRNAETWLHEELAEFRLRGEWYLPHERVLSVMDRYADGVPAPLSRPAGHRVPFNRCKYGHHYSRENTVMVDGKRRCKICLDYEMGAG